MQLYENTERIVIDALRICYQAEAELINLLESLKHGKIHNIGDFKLIPQAGKYFKHIFLVQFNLNGLTVMLGKLKFEMYGKDDSFNLFDNGKHKIWLSVENRMLYSSALFESIQLFSQCLSLVLNNITSLDLAFDSITNTHSILNKYLKDKNVKTIINGEWIKDRKSIIQEVKPYSSFTLDRLKYPSKVFCQKKAISDKTKGITVSFYNKKAEILIKQEKDYILNYYSNPKSLHRIEVHLNNQELKDYFSNKKSFDISDLYNQTILKELFLFHLESVIRFTQKRKPIKWEELLHW